MTTPLDLARADAGYHEQPPGSNRTKFGDRFWPGQPSPWCAEMVSCNTRDAAWVGPWNASVGFYRNIAREMGLLVDLPAALDAIAGGMCVAVGFEWERDTWPDHMGWLLAQPGAQVIATLEGNTPGTPGILGDEVAYMTRPTSLVAFYAVVKPRAGELAQPVAPPITPPAPVHPHGPVLPSWMFLAWHTADAKGRKRPGFTNHGDRVGVLQQYFNRLGGPWAVSKVDSILGPETNDRIHRLQRTNRLEEDGIVGQATWRAAFGS